MIARISPPRGPRSPRTPTLPSGVPKPPKPPHSLALDATVLTNVWPQPPQWPGSDLEWITWQALVKRGFKIFGRPQVRGHTDDYLAADAFWQIAIGAPGLNIDKDFFRGDFLLVPGRRSPSPGPPYSKGIVLDPENPFTHANTGHDRLRRAILAQNQYLLVWLDASDLYTRPDEVVRLAIQGQDVSSIARGTR